MNRFALRTRPELEFLEGRLLLNAGALDASFGTGGVATLSLSGSLITATDLVQPDGKVVLGGLISIGLFPATESLVVERLLSNGEPDTTFGTDGMVTAISDDTGGISLALQGDGKLLVAAPLDAFSFDDFGNTIMRFLPNGSVDTSFGTNGTVTLPNLTDGRLALQSDGKILIAGATASNVAKVNALVLARLNPDGSLDSSFGNGGVADTTLNGSAQAGVIGLGLQPDGRIIVGATEVGVAMLTRYYPNGALDPSFGAGGMETVPNLTANGLALYPSGRIVVAGTQPNPGNDGNLVVLGFTSNGSLDAAFGENGIALVQAVADGSSLSLDSSGRILVGGESASEAEATNILIARLNPDGSKDVSFGNNGIAVAGIAHGVPGGTSALDLAVQADGSVVAAAYVNGALAAVRYTTDAPLPTANQRFVAQVYLDLLTRPAESAALSGWSSLLDQGIPRQLVAQFIEASPEFATDLVRSLYSTYLHRQPDPQGLAAWVSYLESGASAESIATRLVSSPEFRAEPGNGTNDGFLDALYQSALNRSVDSATRLYWDQFFGLGGTAAQIAAAIFSSPEYRFDVVEYGYSSFLRRAGDLGGVVSFTNALAAGASDAFFLSVLVGSEEYFQLVT